MTARSDSQYKGLLSRLIIVSKLKIFSGNGGVVGKACMTLRDTAQETVGFLGGLSG